MQGDDLRFDLELDFQTALFGGEKRIRITHLENCGTCSGSGVAPGASVNTCSDCGGRGSTVQVVHTIMGRLQQQVRCPTCGGTGSLAGVGLDECAARLLQLQRRHALALAVPPPRRQRAPPLVAQPAAEHATPVEPAARVALQAHRRGLCRLNVPAAGQHQRVHAVVAGCRVVSSSSWWSSRGAATVIVGVKVVKEK